MDLLIQDVRYGLRRLAASPLFTVMAVLIIGLGIAANTVVFSAVNAFLLRPLPFADPARVVHVYQHSDEGQPQSSSFPAYEAIASRTDVFSGASAMYYKVDLGFNSAALALVTTNAAQAGYQASDSRLVYSELESRLTALPGVQSVVRTSRPPLGRGPTNTLVIEGYISPTGTNTAEVPSAVVTPGFFEDLGVRMLHGRTFRPQDDNSAPRVAVVNEAMAQRYWGTADVVGRRFGYDGAPDSWVEIVGVVANIKVESLTENPRPQLYRPWDQTGFPIASFIVRTSGNPSDLTATIGRVVRGYDSKLPIMQLVTVNDSVDQQLLVPRLAASVLAGFSLTAVVLAALGLYAVVAFAVRERTKEVGIRLALGARGTLVVWAMVRGIMLTVGIGLAAGLLVTLGSARALSNVLFNVSATDPATVLVMTAVLTLVAAVAAWIPALRATRVDPAVVLRYQ